MLPVHPGIFLGPCRGSFSVEIPAHDASVKRLPAVCVEDFITEA